jgi:hypothetical protein
LNVCLMSETSRCQLVSVCLVFVFMTVLHSYQQQEKHHNQDNKKMGNNKNTPLCDRDPKQSWAAQKIVVDPWCSIPNLILWLKIQHTKKKWNINLAFHTVHPSLPKQKLKQWKNHHLILKNYIKILIINL